MFSISFYIFSLFISYSDYKTFRIPNIIIGTMTLFLIIFGIFEDKLSLFSIILPIIILIFFIILMIFDKKLAIGGGDIKYYMVVGLYLDIYLFSIFLIVTGLLQTFVLIYRQTIQNRRVVAMAPVIFCSVIFTELINFLGLFPKI